MEEKNVEVLEQDEDGFTLLELLKAIKDNIVLLMAICITSLVIGVVYTYYFITPMYTASVDISISFEDTASVNEKNTIVTNVKKNIVEFIKIKDVVTPVLSKNGITENWKTVADRISATPVGEAALVRVYYEDPDPEQAKKMVVAFAEELQGKINLDENNEGENSLRFATEVIHLINRPLANDALVPTSPNKTLNVLISLLLGGITGVVVVILKEQFSTRFASKKEIENLLEIPVLTMIPEIEDGDHID